MKNIFSKLGAYLGPGRLIGNLRYSERIVFVVKTELVFLHCVYHTYFEYLTLSFQFSIELILALQ